MSEPDFDTAAQVVRSEMRSYYALMPNIADDVLDLYEYRLYGHYLRVCGEQNKPCVEKTVTTASRCGMSVGKVSEARRSLAEKGFVALHEVNQGNLTRVFVTLLDVWPKNVVYYSERSPGEQQRSSREQRSSHERQCSPGELYLHESRRSPGERPKNKPPIKNKLLGKKKPPPIGSRGDDVKAEGLAGEGAALKEEGTACSYGPAVRSDLIALAKAMLEECGLVAEIAEGFAQRVDFETLREYVMAWRGDPGAGVGALKYRIEHNWRHGPLIAQDYADPFYLKYRTPEEIALEEAERAARLGDDQTPAVSPAVTVTPPAPLSEHAKLWARVLEDMGLGAPTNSFRLVFADTAPVTSDGDELIISAPASVLDILRNRYGRKILRAVHGAAGRPLLVAFVAKERIEA